MGQEPRSEPAAPVLRDLAGVWLRRVGVTGAAAASIPFLVPQAALAPGDAPALDALHAAWLPLTAVALTGAMALAVVLVWSRGDRGGRDLAVFLAGGALALGLLLGLPEETAAIFEGDAGGPGLTWLSALMVAVWMLAVAGFVRFAATFPRPANLDDMVRAMSSGRGEPRPSFVARGIWWGFGHAWGIAAAVVALLALGLMLQSPGAQEAAMVLLFVFSNSILLIALVLLPRLHSVAEGQARRQTLWVALGVGLGLILLPLTPLLGTLLAAGFFGGPAGDAFARAAAPTLWAAGAAVFVGCLAIAIFADGIFDPRLALRRSVLWGGLSVLLVLLFAVVEEATQSLVLHRLDIGSPVGGWVGGAAAALAFTPLRARLERAIGHWPAAGEAAGPVSEVAVGDGTRAAV
jgi:hypothetical protein